MFTLLFSKDYTFIILQPSHQFPHQTFSSSCLLDSCYGINIHGGQGGQQSRPLSPQHAQSTLNEPQSTYHSGLELLNSLLRSEAPSVTHVAPVLRDRRNSTHLEKRMNPLSQTQFMAHSSNSNNMPSSLILQQKPWILSTPSFIRLKGNPKPKLQLPPKQAIKLPQRPEQPF